MIFGKHAANTLEQFEGIKARAVKAALMADGHLGYIMPVGGVAAYDNEVSINGVGFDIACGNCAIQTNLTLSDVMGYDVAVEDIANNPHLVTSNKKLAEFANSIAAHISFGIGRSNLADDAPIDHSLFEDLRWGFIPNTNGHRDDLREKARKQLGTVGSGNHYVDVFVDRVDSSIWVGVHFGSRGFGHTIASSYLALGQGGSWGDRGKEIETIVSLDTQIGKDYWDLMSLAGEYAYAGREWVTRKVVELLGGYENDMVHNHHNFAWKENHLIKDAYKDVIVVRKGATPARPNQRGFVGGSMGDDAVILEGTDDQKMFGPNICHDITTAHRMGIWAEQHDALYSTVHGAGRVMSRTEAAGKRDRKTGQLKRNKETGEIINAGKISPDMMNDWLASTGVVLRGGGLDEAPQAYRRLTDVLAAQGDTITVLHTLKPLIVCMAGANEFDPYKD